MDHRILRAVENEAVSKASRDIFEALSRFTGVLSAAGGTAVVMTAMMFPSMVRGKTFAQLIISISLHNILTGVGLCFGWPVDYTICKIQAVITMLGCKGSWCLIVLMSFQLRSIIRTGSMAFTSNQMLCIYLAYQSVQMCLPFLMGAEYGIYKHDKGYLSCSYAASDHKASMIAIMVNLDSYQIVMLLILIYSTWKLFGEVREARDRLNADAMRKVEDLKSSASLYPIFMMVVWLPLSVSVITDFMTYNSEDGVHVPLWVAYFIYIAVCWANLDGFFNFCIFFYNGTEARRQWTELLEKYVLGRSILSACECIHKNSSLFCRSCCSCFYDQDNQRDEDSFSAIHKDGAIGKRDTISARNLTIGIEAAMPPSVWNGDKVMHSSQGHDVDEDFEDDVRMSISVAPPSSHIRNKTSPAVDSSGSVLNSNTNSAVCEMSVVSAIHNMGGRDVTIQSSPNQKEEI